MQKTNRKESLISEAYYQRIKCLNIRHYAGEIGYYSKAAMRPAEESILSTLKKGSVVLDLGCGSGRFSIGAAKKGFAVTGLDITQEAIDASSARAKNENLQNVTFVCGDMTEIPFDSNFFDYVFCPRFSINAVATVEKQKRAVSEMIRVVKNGGVVHIESFNKFYLGNGLYMPLHNFFVDIWRHIKMAVCKISGTVYEGLLPGDIIYKANKTAEASVGYAHLPTFIELKRLIPNGYCYKMYSIPQIIGKKKFDVFKYFRYSIWIFITK
jgi:ubiquinone/menaquinone biosynthesis C-methylase UbiE